MGSDTHHPSRIRAEDPITSAQRDGGVPDLLTGISGVVGASPSVRIESHGRTSDVTFPEDSPGAVWGSSSPRQEGARGSCEVGMGRVGAPGVERVDPPWWVRRGRVPLHHRRRDRGGREGEGGRERRVDPRPWVPTLTLSLSESEFRLAPLIKFCRR